MLFYLNFNGGTGALYKPGTWLQVTTPLHNLQIQMDSSKSLKQLVQYHSLQQVTGSTSPEYHPTPPAVVESVVESAVETWARVTECIKEFDRNGNKSFDDISKCRETIFEMCTKPGDNLDKNGSSCIGSCRYILGHKMGGMVYVADESNTHCRVCRTEAKAEHDTEKENAKRRLPQEDNLSNACKRARTA